MTGTQKARRKGLRRALLIILPLLLLVALALALQNRATVEATSDEILTFNHRKHIAAGVQCLFCHPGGMTGMISGIPSVQKCVGCHQNVQVTSQEGQATVDQLIQIWEERKPLTWPKLVDLPDFVYFSHFPHISAGKNCEKCHGDVSQMTMAVPAYRINMGFCLKNCHRHEEPAKRERLMDCATCHQ
jgi:hypothetical protein